MKIIEDKNAPWGGCLIENPELVLDSDTGLFKPLPNEEDTMKISKQWTPQERLNVVSALLTLVQDDIYANRYSVPGRPNITSLQHVISAPAETLEENRASLEEMLNQVDQRDEDAIPFPDPGFSGGPVS